jgi:hypothetical protein
MAVEVSCRRCGESFDADRRAILAGPAVWRLCPACRHPNPPGGLAAGAPDPRPHPASLPSREPV